jgi:hypothetical protein
MRLGTALVHQIPMGEDDTRRHESHAVFAWQSVRGDRGGRQNENICLNDSTKVNAGFPPASAVNKLA